MAWDPLISVELMVSKLVLHLFVFVLLFVSFLIFLADFVLIAFLLQLPPTEHPPGIYRASGASAEHPQSTLKAST